MLQALAVIHFIKQSEDFRGMCLQSSWQGKRGRPWMQRWYSQLILMQDMICQLLAHECNPLHLSVWVQRPWGLQPAYSLQVQTAFGRLTEQMLAQVLLLLLTANTPLSSESLPRWPLCIKVGGKLDRKREPTNKHVHAKKSASRRTDELRGPRWRSDGINSNRVKGLIPSRRA